MDSNTTLAITPKGAIAALLSAAALLWVLELKVVRWLKRPR